MKDSMSSKYDLALECRYCGHENEVVYDESSDATQIFKCESCGKENIIIMMRVFGVRKLEEQQIIDK